MTPKYLLAFFSLGVIALSVTANCVCSDDDVFEICVADPTCLCGNVVYKYINTTRAVMKSERARRAKKNLMPLLILNTYKTAKACRDQNRRFTNGPNCCTTYCKGNSCTWA